MKWNDYFMGLARYVASKSKDPTTKVGSVAVGPDHEVRETGYNGIPRGVQDLPERMVRPEKYLWTEHSEANLVASAARPRLKGTTVYVTHLCCNACARLLVSSGVSKVVMADEPTSMPPELHETALAILKEAGVIVEYYSPTESKQ